MILLLPVRGIPEVEPGAPLGRWITNGVAAGGQAIERGDILVVAQKIVSKAEGRIVKLENVTRWAGNRPSLPDGLPVLGAAPQYENAYFAFGNSHFGMSAGPVMGKVIAEIIAGRKPDIDLTPFRPTRFGGG